MSSRLCRKLIGLCPAYMRWMKVRNFQVDSGDLSEDRRVPSCDDLVNMPKESIVKVLCFFIHEVRDKSGNCYNRDTLYDLITMINCYFKQKGKDFSFYDDSDFFVLKNTLDNRMKELSSEGLIAPRIQAVPISTDELNILWEKEYLRRSYTRTIIGDFSTS